MLTIHEKVDNQLPFLANRMQRHLMFSLKIACVLIFVLLQTNCPIEEPDNVCGSFVCCALQKSSGFEKKHMCISVSQCKTGNSVEGGWGVLGPTDDVWCR